MGTDLWEHMQRYTRPIIIGVNQLTTSLSDFDSTIAQASITSVQRSPSCNTLDQGEGFHRIIDLLKIPYV
ncbi:MAG: hypothetical protein R2818_02305 [Flavobacteriales bacterium]